MVAKRKNEEIERLAYAINSTGGSDPSPEAKAIIHRYTTGEIDYETAVSLIKELFTAK